MKIFVFLLFLFVFGNFNNAISQSLICENCEVGSTKTISNSKSDNDLLKIGENRYQIFYESYKCCLKATPENCVYGLNLLKVVAIGNGSKNQDVNISLMKDILKYLIQNSKRYLNLQVNSPNYLLQISFPSCLPDKLNSSINCVNNCSKLEFEVRSNGVSGSVNKLKIISSSDCGNSPSPSCINLSSVIDSINVNEQFTFNFEEPNCNENCYWTLNGNSINNSFGENNWFGSNDYKNIIFKTNNVERMKLYRDGKIAIGLDGTESVKVPEGYLVGIKGKLIAEEIMVQNYSSWPDFVFGKNYKLMDLDALEDYVKKNKSLPGIPNEQEVKANGGVELGQLNKLLLQKLEENTLYLIKLNKQNEELRKELELLKAKVK